MGIATGLTALRMLAIEAASIVAARKEGNNLVFTTYGGTDINVGNIQGEKGDPGPQGTSVPIGGIIEWPGDTAPANWLMLTPNATFVAAEYPALAAVIGTKYGGTAANPMLPPRSGRVGVGVSAADTEFNTLGKLSGEKTHSLTAAENGQHTHIQDSHNHTQNAHTHVQDSHNHTQNAHTHVQDAHAHTQVGHAHGGSTGGAGSHYHAPANGTGYVFAGGVKGSIANQRVASGTSFYVPGHATSTNVNYPYNTDTAPDHTHTVATNTQTPGIYANTATNQNTTATNNAATATNQNTTAINNSSTATNQDSGTGAGHNNIQPSIAMNYIIRAA